VRETSTVRSTIRGAPAARRVLRTIQAPADVVFETIADPNRFAQAISGVTHLEVSSGMKSGVGTRFRQTRTMNGMESVMEFEVTEYVKTERLRILNQTHGTIWDSLFTFTPKGSSTKLAMRMEARARRLLPRLLLPWVCRFIKKAVEKDIDAVKATCERHENPGRYASEA
jgi:hypothetical protein